VVEIWDDGDGGARLAPTGGLAGLAGRVEALDGRLEVASPEGGPTIVRAIIPVADGAAITTPAGDTGARLPSTEGPGAASGAIPGWRPPDGNGGPGPT
jgi:hypothetical protein